MPVDHFPSTHATWIDAQLTIAGDADPAAADSARSALRRHVMDRYADALRAYVLGSSLRELGEADELVNGFFAAALDRPEFLREWRSHGGPLRRWIINGLLFHARGLRRDRARTRERDAGSSLSLEALAGGEDSGAERAFEREWANALLRSVCERVRIALESDGDSESFEAFRRHVIDGRTHAAVALELGMTTARCAAIVRTVTDRVRAEAVRALVEEGVHREDADSELRRIEGLLGD
jgi:RNA polymerase sigma-70 factor (ECF subfamily)